MNEREERPPHRAPAWRRVALATGHRLIGSFAAETVWPQPPTVGNSVMLIVNSSALCTACATIPGTSDFRHS